MTTITRKSNQKRKIAPITNRIKNYITPEKETSQKFCLYATKNIKVRKQQKSSHVKLPKPHVGKYVRMLQKWSKVSTEFTNFRKYSQSKHYFTI